MDKKTIFSKIDNATNAARVEEFIAFTKKCNEVAELYQQALKRCKEVEDLCEIINYAISKGYAIEDGGNSLFPSLKGAPKLLTDGINHGLGFYGKKMVRINCIDFSVRYDKIGYEAGGYCGCYDFYITNNDVFFGRKSFSEYNPNYTVFGQEYWSRGVGYLKSFITNFDKFKAKVYDFVEHIDQYKCYC